jgi:hypothetical protein
MLKDAGIDENVIRPLYEHEQDVVPCEGKFYVADSTIHGKGVFASADFAKFQIIAPARIGHNRTPIGRYANHAFTPNCRFISYGGKDLHLQAMTDIATGDELTVHYKDALATSVKSLKHSQ